MPHSIEGDYCGINDDYSIGHTGHSSSPKAIYWGREEGMAKACRTT